MSEKINNMSQASAAIQSLQPTPQKTEKKAMRKCFSLCGWSVAITTVAMFAVFIGIGVVFGVMEMFFPDAINIYNNNLLLINEAAIAGAVLWGILPLLFLPAQTPEKNPMSAKMFVTLMCVSYLIGTVGNLISNIGLTFWNLFTGNEVTNDLAEILSSISPWQMILCTGILAPIIEEFLFRKLLIDRMYPHGEMAAILTSAVLFGLFHQNFSQFLYAFGIGVVLGYLYCRTGSYIKVTLLHMAFNFIGGVIPTIITMDLYGFFEIMENTAEQDILNVLPQIAGDYALPLAAYLVYTLFTMALNIAGVVLLVLNYKKISIKKSQSTLSKSERVSAVTLNAGMITAVALLLIIMVSTLFTS